MFSFTPLSKNPIALRRLEEDHLAPALFGRTDEEVAQALIQLGGIGRFFVAYQQGLRLQPLGHFIAELGDATAYPLISGTGGTRRIFWDHPDVSGLFEMVSGGWRRCDDNGRELVKVGLLRLQKADVA